MIELEIHYNYMDDSWYYVIPFNGRRIVDSKNRRSKRSAKRVGKRVAKYLKKYGDESLTKVICV